MLSFQIAQQAIINASNDVEITKDAVADLLQGSAGTTMAGITYVTKVKTAAAFKEMNIKKVVKAQVQLFNQVNDYNLFANKVNKSASTDDFVTSETWFEHTEVFSVVKHKAKGDMYLYAIFNKSESVYTIDGREATKEEVAQYMTPSEAKKLLDDSGTVYNKANDVTHNVICRTISLENITSIRACGYELAV